MASTSQSRGVWLRRCQQSQQPGRPRAIEPNRELQSTASKAVAVMNISQNEAQQSVELTQQVHAVLNDITTVISKFQRQTHEISDAVSQQANVAEEVSRNVENVRLLTDDTVESSSSMSESLAGLKTNSDALTTVVKQFKV